MKCFIFSHDWSHWHPTTSAIDRIQMKICKKCGKIKTSETFHHTTYIPLQDLKDLTDKYFKDLDDR